MCDGVRRLRRDAIAAFDAAVAAVQPAGLIPRAITVDDTGVQIWGEPLPEVSGRRVVAAIGKAAPALADAWLELAPGWADRLFVLAPRGVPVTPRVAAAATVHHGAHPYPDEAGVQGCRELLALAAGLSPHDLLVVLLSGGGSALLAAPAEGLALDDLQTVTQGLLRAGAPIGAVNTVRRELLAAAGGGLARTAAPARVVTLVLSDVLGDPLPTIASGPTVPSPTTARDALAVLERFGVRGTVPSRVAAFLASRSRTASDTAWQALSRVQILANNRTAVEGAARSLERRRYQVVVHGGFLEGEASARGHQLGGLARALAATGPTAFLVGGETTVSVRGTGRGGRNHELALAAALQLEGNGDRVVLSAGTDGVDGLADGAGAAVDPSTVARLRDAGIDPAFALADNDSGSALAAIGDAVVTGPTGTNVCDVAIVLARRAEAT